MQRGISWLGIMMLIALLVACAPAAEEQALPAENVPVMAPADSADDEDDEEVQPMPTEEDEGKQPEEGEQVVTPVSVDLGAITPEPETEGEEEPREVPAPGVPNPQVMVVSKASQDLSGRLGVDVSEVALVSAEAVQWRDSSLGCPEPGMVYLQAITPGYEIVLEAEGEEYHYHTDMRGQVVYCENPQEPASCEGSS